MKLLVQILLAAGVGIFVPGLLFIFISNFSFIGLPLAFVALGVLLITAGCWIAKKSKVEMGFESDH